MYYLLISIIILIIISLAYLSKYYHLYYFDKQNFNYYINSLRYKRLKEKGCLAIN